MLWECLLCVEVVCWIDQTVYGLSNIVRVVSMTPVCIYMFLPWVLFVYAGSYLLIYELESWITGVCSQHVVSLCDFAYYVVG